MSEASPRKFSTEFNVALVKRPEGCKAAGKVARETGVAQAAPIVWLKACAAQRAAGLNRKRGRKGEWRRPRRPSRRPRTNSQRPGPLPGLDPEITLASLTGALDEAGAAISMAGAIAAWGDADGRSAIAPVSTARLCRPTKRPPIRKAAAL
jgi:hypothetical protein